MPGGRLLSDYSFDPEATHAMGIAFEKACRKLMLANTDDPVNRVLALKIIEVAKAGERDPDKLQDAVLRWVGSMPPSVVGGNQNLLSKK